MILPSRTLVLHTPMTPPQAAQALQGSLVPRRRWAERLTLSGGGGFVGTVTGTTFESERDINYRNSFLPRMKGTFIADAERGGTRVALVLALKPLVAIFMSVWLGLVTLFAVSMAIAALRGSLGPEGGSPMIAIVPLAMLTFGLVLPPRLAFGYEARQALAFLKRTLSAQELEPPAR